MPPVSTQELARDLRAEDPHRGYHATEVDLALVSPTTEEAVALAQTRPDARWTEGWAAILVRLQAGDAPGPLLLREEGGRYLMNPSPLGGDRGNSLALLTALRASGVKKWGALLVTEPISKQEEEAPEDLVGDGWSWPQEEKEAAKAKLYAWAALLIAAILAASEKWIPEMVQRGADWGGGDLTDDELDALIQDSIASQAAYAAAFQQAINARIDKLLDTKWGSYNAYEDAVSSMFSWAKNRAEKYGSFGGNTAWRDGLLSSMAQKGVKGGIWICTFGPASCHDCITLHGTFLTAEELKKTWGHTLCNGACNCGVMPANDPAELLEEDLALVDATVGETDFEG